MKTISYIVAVLLWFEGAAIAQNGSLDIPKSPEAPALTIDEPKDSYARRIAVPDTTDPKLPNVLIIGDSLSIRYTQSMRQALEGKANVFRIPDNARSTDYSLERMEEWLGRRKWDSIVFNWGAWDCVQSHETVYEANLRLLVGSLLETQAKLLFVGSAPTSAVFRAHGGDLTRFEARLAKFNEVAQQVMKELDIPTIDPASLVSSHLDIENRSQGYPLTKEGYHALGQRIAEAIAPPDSRIAQVPGLALQHYMVVFSAQGRDGNQFSKSHTFATFAKGNEDQQILEQFTISWMPKSHIPDVTKTWPQTGDNMDLIDTLDLCQKNGARISAWGPFLIEPILYTRAKSRRAYLESGKPRYLILDKNWRRRSENRAFHCVHAVSDIGGYLETQQLRGEAASELVVKHFQPWISQRERDNNWLLTRLGLRKYNIDQRKHP